MSYGAPVMQPEIFLVDGIHTYYYEDNLIQE